MSETGGGDSDIQTEPNRFARLAITGAKVGIAALVLAGCGHGGQVLAAHTGKAPASASAAASHQSEHSAEPMQAQSAQPETSSPAPDQTTTPETEHVTTQSVGRRVLHFLRGHPQSVGDTVLVDTGAPGTDGGLDVTMANNNDVIRDLQYKTSNPSALPKTTPHGSFISVSYTAQGQVLKVVAANNTPGHDSLLTESIDTATGTSNVALLVGTTPDSERVIAPAPTAEQAAQMFNQTFDSIHAQIGNLTPPATTAPGGD